MKRAIEITFVLVVVAILAFQLVKDNPSKSPKSGSITTNSEKGFNSPTLSGSPAAVSNPSAPFVRTVDISTNLASRAASPNSTPVVGTDTNELATLPPLTVLDKARVTIHNYHAALGENPVGTNPEIAAALQGKNAKQINFLAESGLRLNAKGELVDGYGTPFFFHQISGNEMEIRSAGPDKVMWTSDDMVTR